MDASESETAGLGRGKFLAWRSYSRRDMGKDSGIVSGRSFGSISGRDIGRDIANWWTAAVEQTSTFLMDEIPATFAELREEAKELKPQLQRGSSFSNFTLPWRTITISSKADEGSKRQEDFAFVPEASGFVPSVASPERVERSLLTTTNLGEKVQEPSASSPKPLERSPLTTTNLGEKVQEPSASSPKPLERSLSTRGHDEKIQEPTRTSPKPFKWFPLMATKCEEKTLFTTEISKPAKGSFVISTNHMEMSSPGGGKSPIADVDTHMSSELSSQNSSPRESSSGESSPLSFSNSEERVPQNFTKDVEKRPLSVMEDLKLCESISVKSAEVVEMPFLTSEETSKPMEGLPLGDVKTSSSSESSPVSTTDPRISSQIHESQRRTKCVLVEASPSDATSLFIVSQDFLRGEDIAPGHTGVHALEVPQRPKFLSLEKFLTNTSDESNPNSSAKRVAGSGVGSAKRSCSSRSLALDQHLEETDIRFSPQLTVVGTPDSSDRAVHFNKVVLPRDEIFPGNTNSLPQIKVRTPRLAEDLQGVNEKSVAWESTQATHGGKNCEDARTHVSGSLLISPQYALGDSQTAKLLRRWKLKGRGARKGSDTILGKEKSPTREGNTITDSVLKYSSELHRKFSGSLESRRPDFSYRNWTDPDLKTTMPTGSDREIIDPSSEMRAGRLEAHGCNEASKRSVSSKQQLNSSSEASLKISSRPWTFKWKWGSKSRSKSNKEVLMAAPPPLPRPSTKTQKRVKSGGIYCTSNAEGDARDAFNSHSDCFSGWGTTEKFACDRAPKHRRGWSWGAGPTAALCSGSNPVNSAFTPSQPRLPTRDAQELLLPPRKLLVPPIVNVIKEYPKRGPSIEVRSTPEASASQPTADTDIFEDCFGSFRSVESSTKSRGSFRSIESPGINSAVLKRTGLSTDEEWEDQMPSSFPEEFSEMYDEQRLTSSKFTLKCSQVQHFNRFLRAQKERLRSGVDSGNSDCFSIIIPRKGLELSSIVSALGYAWLQENSSLKVSGNIWYPVPMIDMPRQKMYEHKDSIWLFDVCGIDPRALLFADEVELSTLVEARRIKMSIIGQDVLMTRNEVGSVCTILMEMLLAGHRCLLQPPYIKAFILAGILLDTENLDFGSRRDIEMSNLLVEWLGCVGRTTFYNQLRKVEDDSRVSKLISQYYDSQPSGQSTTPYIELATLKGDQY
ncbi:uncharacterized protein [Physcomitrium patens]|uniref:uncharacterized protein isoform X5 n=1 Tax=Physcomitrium patens TaxID=3218 RepID=UPI000D16B01E|nr:uncharacterized protein LOC112274306 isoform X5 [Physcomitrium patens]|eukprot:XP_024359441.1 uncharacterized protein LOC112274306 isoform X5 [Physcomitrella patens]